MLQCFQLLFIIIICLFSCNEGQKVNNNLPQVFGFNSKSKEGKWSDGNPSILEVPLNNEITFELYGDNLSKLKYVAFTRFPLNRTENCGLKLSTQAFLAFDNTENFAKIQVKLKSKVSDKHKYYICISAGKSNTSSVNFWYAQGKDSHLSFKTYEKKSLLPLWLQISFIIILFSLSGLFSGLNLGLMSLNMTELNIVQKAGSSSEQRYAKAIIPVRKRGNFLLCTLLLGNVLVNNSLTILMDDLTGSGIMAIVFSTIGIVILGEIIPQAICSRHGLCIGAKTIWITKAFMLLTGVLSFPISLMLDVVLGKELGQIYTREKLDILVKEQQVHGSVVKTEAQIISGALTLTRTMVKDIMTPLVDVFMISTNAVLDFATMNEIVRNGFTRVPVFEGERCNIKAVLNVKDLAFIDPDDGIPVSTVCHFYNRSILVVDENTNLRAMLEDFRQGKAHIAFVEKQITECDGDPYSEIIGLVTLEDVIEEIIQAEIMDETDVITDNVKKHRRLLRNQDFSVFNIPETGKYPRLSPQLKVAALRHLSSNVTYFNEDLISRQVLQSLLNANIVVEHTFSKSSNNMLYSFGQLANYAVLILQGKANVEVGTEHLLFEAGPFVLLGESLFAKTMDEMPSDKEVIDIGSSKGEGAADIIETVSAKCSFTPDYSAVASSDMQYLKITAKHYLFARILSIWQTAGLTSFSPSKVQSNSSDTNNSPGAGDISASSLTAPAVSTSDAPESTPNGLSSSQVPVIGYGSAAPTAVAFRPKRSLTSSSIQAVRDFYQTEWEKLNIDPIPTSPLLASHPTAFGDGVNPDNTVISIPDATHPLKDNSKTDNSSDAAPLFNHL